MNLATRIALSATPLAIYFYTLGLLHSGKRPKMISGPFDMGLLAIGLGGLVAFGPLGRAVLGRLAGEPSSTLAWSIWLGLVVLWSLVLAGSATLRVTVYQISPEALDLAVRDALGELEGRFFSTMKGFENPQRQSGVMIKPFPLLRSGIVEAYGQNPDGLIRELKPKLRESLKQYPGRGTSVSVAMYGLACLTMVVPVACFFLTNPRAMEALRKLIQTLRW